MFGPLTGYANLFVGIVGYFFLSLWLLKTFFAPALNQTFARLGPHYQTALMILLAWVMSMGMRGTVAVWGFAFDALISYVFTFNTLVGLLGILIGLSQHRTIKSYFATLRRRRPQSSVWELSALLAITLIVLIYAYAGFVPWYDWDEMVIYGKEPKEFALGFTYTDYLNLNPSYLLGSKLSEALASQTLFAVSHTYIERLLRLVHLVMSGGLLFIFLRWLNIKYFWALLAVIALFVTPDLHYLAVSLKVDIIVMMFEMFAAILLLVTMMTFLPEFRHENMSRIPIILLAAIFSSFALGTRQSSLYLGILTVSVGIYCIMVEERKTSARINWTLILTCIFALSTVLYFQNILSFGNPIYPFKAPWPFEAGVYIRTLAEWQSYYNVNFLPPILNQLYLILHLGLGIEKFSKVFDFLPHAAHKSISMSCLSPALLSFFLVPFFAKRDKKILICAAVFLYWLTAWSLGLHFSRIFIAASSITIVIATIIANMEVKSVNPLQRWLIYSTRIGLIISCIALAAWFAHSSRAYPHSWRTLISDDARHKSNQVLMQRFIETKGDFPSKSDFHSMSAKLTNLGQPYVHADFSRAMHIFFQAGFFGGTAFDNEGQFAPLQQAGCYFVYKPNHSTEDIRRISEYFSEVIFSNSNWQLSCQGHRKLRAISRKSRRPSFQY